MNLASFGLLILPRVPLILTAVIVICAGLFLLAQSIGNSEAHRRSIRRRATIVGMACFGGLVVVVGQDSRMAESLIPHVVVSISSALVAYVARRVFQA